ncbi:MAG: PKD domain-containing protein [Mariniphaga sp.]|jgi:PKD repeat protein|nr:PKD domain-containing protein [Mariniphaga sp.]
MKKYLLIYLFVGWGLAVSGQSVIQSYEYWFNSNSSGKTMEAIASPAASFELAVQADASHLPDGVNTFTVRFKDDLGNWSSPLTRFFVKMPEQQFSTEPKNIVAYEYRLNNEPFVKQGVSPASSFVLEEQISAANLPDGLNTFTVRFKDDLGNWSSPLTRFFVKIPEQQFSTEPKNIVAYEYRLNSGSSVKQEFAPTTTYVLDQQIEATLLPDGLNVFIVRFRDNLGNWSSPLTRFIVKMPEIDTSVSENLIKAYEYRVEDASGNAVVGSGSTTFTFVSLDTPVNPALIEFEVALSHVPKGDYTVHFRALDIRNQWSSVLSRTVEKEAMPTAEFSFSGGLCSGSAIQFTNESFDTDSWLWDFGDGTTSTEFEPEHVYSEAGDYEVSLTATDSESGSENSVTDIITIYPDYETEATIAICASETPYTFGTQQLTESGTYTETFQTIHGCDSVVTLTLIVNPVYNHTIEVIVSENELPFVFGSSEITESGAYVETFVSINGCDSIVTLNLEVASGDISPPEVVCNPYQVKLRQNGKYVLTKTDIRLITAGTFDDFTSYEDLVIDIYPDTFGCSHVGKDVNVLVTVTDLAGNVGECQSVITVYDKTPPVALCRDITLTLDENGQAFITPADIDQGIPENGYPEWAVTNSGKPYGSYDACGVASIALNKYAFDCGDLGQQLVTLEVTDPSGNFSNCVATVTVVDTSPFSIQPVSDIVLEVAPGVCETETDYPEIAVTGTCGGEVELIEGIGSGGLFPAGTTIETWVATHASGKTDTMSFAVTVIPENDPPTLNPIPNIQADEDTPPLNVVLTGISYGNDCWEQEVTVTAESSGTSLIEEIVVNYEKGSTTGSLVIYIIPDASGKAEVTVTVEDSENAKVSQSFFVEIHPVNDPPFVVNPVPDQEIIASYVLKLPLNARPGNIFDDIDDEELSFDVTQLGISGLPDWAVVMNDTLYCTPALKDTGCVDMIVTATDASGASAADTFQICVLNYPVGVNNFTVNSLDVELYPNPANDIVNIEINGENPKPVGVTVFTVTGKKVLEKEFYQSNIVSFSMRDHVSGIYFVKIKIDNYEKVKKLILNRK